MPDNLILVQIVVNAIQRQYSFHYKTLSTCKRNNRNLQNLSNVPKKKQIYFGFQYINESSEKFVQNISKLISKHFIFLKCIPYFKKGRNLLSFFLQKLKNSIENFNWSL